jgi:hypothetical protein
LAKFNNDEKIRYAAVKNLKEQNILRYIAKNDKIVKVRLAASLNLTDLSERTENLVKLIRIYPDSECSGEINLALMNLYQNQKLSHRDKALILELEGKILNEHTDSTYHQDCSFLPDETRHTDIPQKYFQL